MPSSAWLRTYQPRPGAVARLVCLPPAGASAPFFRDWLRYLPPGVELTSVQYPGRLDRLNDPPVSQMDALADAVAEVLSPRADQPFALFGHSMGAALAFEVAARLSGTPDSRLVRLFVSGYPEPSRRRPTSFHQSPDSDLLAELSRLGMIEEALFEDLDLLWTLLPPLRSDYRIVETYHPTADSPLTTPITAMVGVEDDDAPEDSVRAWRELTSGEFRFERFPGGHFYLNERPGEIVKLVTSHLVEGLE
jgi:pyochelin biosynthesis protein PchC